MPSVESKLNLSADINLRKELSVVLVFIRHENAGNDINWIDNVTWTFLKLTSLPAVWIVFGLLCFDPSPLFLLVPGHFEVWFSLSGWSKSKLYLWATVVQ